MADAVRSRPPFEELYASNAALPAGMTGEILEPGVLRVTSRPGRGHRKAHKAIVDALRGLAVGALWLGAAGAGG